MTKQTKDYLALALDNVSKKEQIQHFIRLTSDYIGVFKIGLEQFIRFGPEIIELVREKENKVFLDLKLHDIPNTVAKAVAASTEHKINYLTIHTTGGLEMMKAAVGAVRNVKNPPKLIGVTVLTSIDQGTLNKDLRITGLVTDHVTHLAEIAVKAEMDGIVCSAADLPAIKQYLPEEFEVITPGIRLSQADTHDQKRIATPEEAIKNGATILVIGRVVSEAEDPKAAAKAIYKSVKTLY